jgi:hypothetical protein
MRYFEGKGKREKRERWVKEFEKQRGRRFRIENDD